MIATNIPVFEETDADRRRGMLASKALSLDLVSAFADFRPLTEAESRSLAEIKSLRGQRFFSDVLYAVTHQNFRPDIAQVLWPKLVEHKRGLSSVLGREVGIAVAALDYLSNVSGDLEGATLISESPIREIVALSLRDGLTGLFNHAYFYEQIDLEVRRFLRYGALVSLVLIDIDDFKGVNDAFGHREGDRLLASMGKSLTRVSRESDICCRYGGEEFAVILPSTDVDDAEQIASRLSTELAEQLPDGRTMTVSIGVATCTTATQTCRTLVETADAALYQVKNSGKNRVMVVLDGHC